MARRNAKWQAEWAVGQSRSLEGLEVVDVGADGVDVMAGLEQDKAAVLVVLAAGRDGRKVVVAVTSGDRESTESWLEVLRDLKRRGMHCPRLVIADGHGGIGGALRTVYPEAEEHRCWNHRILNVLEKVPKRLHNSALFILQQIPYAKTCQEAERLKKVVQPWVPAAGPGSCGQGSGSSREADGRLL